MATRFVLAIAFAAAFCGIAAAQGGGWAAVEGISPGSRVEVRLSPHGTVEGLVAGVSATGMDIQKPGGSVRQIPKVRIARIDLVGRSHKLRDGLIGAGILGGAGAVFGYTRPYRYSYTYPENGFPVPHDERPVRTEFFGLIAGLAGAVIGAAIGYRHSRTLVYRRNPSAGGATARKAGHHPLERVGPPRRALARP